MIRSLLVLDDWLLDPGRHVEEARALQMRRIEKVTPALQAGRPSVDRSYFVADGLTIPDSMWSLYFAAWSVVQGCFASDALARQHPRADCVLKRYAAPEGRQGWHVDTNPIAAVIYLTECAGGETEFESGLSVRPVPGRLAIFDGHQPHRCAPVRDGEKWAIVCNFYLPGLTQRPDGADHVLLEGG